MIATFAAQPQHHFLSFFSCLDHVFRSRRHFSIQHPRDFREIASEGHTLIHSMHYADSSGFVRSGHAPHHNTRSAHSGSTLLIDVSPLLTWKRNGDVTPTVPRAVGRSGWYSWVRRVCGVESPGRVGLGWVGSGGRTVRKSACR